MKMGIVSSFASIHPQLLSNIVSLLPQNAAVTVAIGRNTEVLAGRSTGSDIRTGSGNRQPNASWELDSAKKNLGRTLIKKGASEKIQSKSPARLSRHLA
ncbi:hypothetical protein [Hyphomicrobium sp. 2TAF46]|uniref:hypothetical protein n=1 Tax=Hyphomicrobium sp. 2TAF46 TaxID=3233019 RepID=UPI003F8E8341